MFPKLIPLSAAACLAVGLLALPFALHSAKPVMAASTAAPAFTKSGDMLPPALYREWIFLTSGIDMSYVPKAAGMQDHSMFDNVFVNPGGLSTLSGTRDMA